MSSQSRSALYRLGRAANWPALAGLLALAAAWLVRPDLSGHGLQAVYTTGDRPLERVALMTANQRGLTADAPLGVQWDGVLFLPQAQRVVLRMPGGVDSRLEIDGQTIYETAVADSRASDRVSLSLVAGSHPLHLEITTPPNREVYYQAGLEWQTLIGWRLVPPEYLYPDAPDPAAAAASVQRGQWAAGLALAAVACALLPAGRLAWERRRLLTSRTALGLAALVILTFGLRLLILRQLTAPPNADVLALGSDHRGYHESALRVLRGTWTEGGFRVQPGMTLALAAVYAIFGPTIRAAQVLQMLLGSLAVLLVFDVARRLFGRAAGWVAGALWATFALPIFYEAQLLTHGLEAVAGLAILWLWVRAVEAPRLGRIAALGLALGAAAVLRPTFLAIGPLAALSLIRGGGPEKRRYDLAGRWLLLALAALIPIAPITWLNYRATGGFQLISANSDVTLYLGNNRDATGLGEYTPAYWATHARVNRGETTYLRQTFVEIGAAPGRWLQLMARKIALYLGDPELPNNVDFYAEGTARSPLLAALPLRFGVMMALGLAGAATCPAQRAGCALAGPARRDVRLWIVLAYAVTQIAVTVAFHVFSRFRAPIYPALAILGGGAIAEAARRLRQGAGREAAAGLLALAASGGLIAAMPFAAERVMSLPIVRALPEGSRRLHAPIGNALTLLGYDPLPAVQPGEPVFITLYWQTREPLPAQLYGTVQVFADLEQGQKLAQADQALGTGSFPDYPTGRWQPGQIVWDRFLLQLPDDAPAPRALTVLVAAYDRATGERVGEATFGPLPVTYARPLDLPADALPVGAKVGEETLTAYELTVDPATLTLTLYWQAARPMAQDGVVFVHLFNAAGEFVLGQDSRPMNGLYGTQAWQPGEGVVDEHRLELPADLPPGEYRIEVGMYDSATQVRLPVVDANGQTALDGAVRLGTVVLGG